MLPSPMNVAIVGASGKLGSIILQHLVAHPEISPTVISRQSSSSTYPSTVKLALIPDALPHSSLVAALQGHTAVIVTIAGALSEVQIKLADAAAAAGVHTFVPADFGSCDSTDSFITSTVPVFAAKAKVREHLKSLALTSQLTWTSLVCGHFFDYGLEHNLIHIDLRKMSALVFDGGDIMWSATTLSTIALATIRVLEMRAETENRIVFIQSLRTSQNEVLETLERLLGRRFQRTAVSSSAYIQQMKALHLADPTNDETFHKLCGVLGLVHGDWTEKDGFAVELLGIQGETLIEVLTEIVAKQSLRTSKDTN